MLPNFTFQYQFWKLQSKANIPRPLLSAQATKPNPKFDREMGDFMLP